MARLVRSLAAAALALTAVAAAPATARACDTHPTPPVAYVPAPPRAPVVVVRAEERRRELKREYRELERSRDRFYATWRGNPWEKRRFERWYDGRRAELDREWERLSAVARWDGPRRHDHRHD